jgi:signal transduction histidine kinase
MDPLRPPLLKQMRPAHWVAMDCALTAAMALAYAVPFRQLADMHGIPDWAAATILAVAVLPAAFRRRWPRDVLALVVAGGAVATAVSSSPAPALAVAFVMYLIPLRFPVRDALRLLAGVLVVLIAAVTAFAIVRHGVYGTGGASPAAYLLVEDGLLVTAAWAIGYSVRQQRLYAASREEQAERRAREQLAEARRARSEERLQIARELHDVVAHSMSLIAVQAGVANYVAGQHPEEAARALSSIEQTSRGALREMRALLGVLRTEEAGTGLDPAPGLADLDLLAERAGEAGVRVGLDVRGERPRLSPGLDLAAYRVVQEAITNVIKHAATDRCRVTVASQEDVLTLEITDRGRAASRNGEGPATGHGITGMRERVAMYGGEFRAAPRPGGGFQVTARFPLVGPALEDTVLAGPAPEDTGLENTGLEDTGP